MKALQFNVTPPGFIAAKAIKPIFGNNVYFKGPFKTVRLVEIPEPAAPAGQWVKLKTIFCGFCGSDLNLMMLHDSPTASPFSSFPCIIGHEVVGRIVEKGPEATQFELGDVVTVNPGLGCTVRKLSPQCAVCAAGRSLNCENSAKGGLPPGMFTGLNSGVTGGFAPFIRAHESQLFKVPDSLGMEAAAMTEPLAVALQTVFDNMPEPSDKILVIGGGVIGNLVIQAVRTLCPDAGIALIEPAAHAAALAEELGQAEIIPFKAVYQTAAEFTGAAMYQPQLGQPVLMGGFDRIYDTVGNSATLNMGLRILGPFGTLSLVGIGSDVKLDLTPLWLKLQNIKGVYGYGRVTYQGETRHVFDLAMEFMNEGRIRTAPLVTHTFRLEDYREMIEVNLNKARHGAVKALVRFD
ncbi:zinc-dependent alcohol dehydrogenase [Desulfatibacillum aliphaticivorans]|uniref:zinc-dependent alcohol dehydrogenase n=1 Tax=Desulfatibacillum aliphaticivorans TaxID=218208 RepID=UPI00042093CC|nr:alcohol dehydrogenase catalytic domain-containing protein [Desulfatibacillum aliphaticivorans]